MVGIRGERVAVALAPGGVVRLRHDELHPAPRLVEAVIEAHRVRDVPEVPKVRQKPDRPLGADPGGPAMAFS